MKLLATEQAPIRQVTQLLGTFSRSFIILPYGKLYYRSVERFKRKTLVICKGYFDKIMHVSKEAIQYILCGKQHYWCQCSHCQGKPICHNKYWYFIIWLREGGASLGQKKTGRQFSTEERQQLINILELKAARFGVRALCENEFNCHIFTQINNTLAISAINKMGSGKVNWNG